MTDLTPAVSDIAAEHAEIINGIETIYGTLIELGYVENTDVQVPPHGVPKDPVAVAPLRAVGLDPETIELIGKLPCFTNRVIEFQREASISRDGIAIAPFSSATSYLLGSGRHDEVREVRVGSAQGEQLLPSSAFKIASSSSNEGFNLAYDLYDKTILQWRPDAWVSCQRFPVTDFMADWIRQIRSLEWLPWLDDFGWEMEAQQESTKKQLADPESATTQEIKATLKDQWKQYEYQGAPDKTIEKFSAQYHVVQEAAYNRYWARRCIYEECGWPENFDQYEFSKRREAFDMRAKELGASAASKRVEALGDLEVGSELRDFYEAAAGKHAAQTLRHHT